MEGFAAAVFEMLKQERERDASVRFPESLEPDTHNMKCRETHGITDTQGDVEMSCKLR